MGRSFRRLPETSRTNGFKVSSKLTVNCRGPKSSSSEPLSSRPRSGANRSSSSATVSSRLSAMSAIFSFARSCNALNFSFWAMPLSCIRAISLPIAARISNPTVARLCWDSPGQARINGVSLRAVSSLPRTPNAVNAQLSFDGAPAVCQAVNRSQANPASESAEQTSFTCNNPGYRASS